MDANSNNAYYADGTTFGMQPPPPWYYGSPPAMPKAAPMPGWGPPAQQPPAVPGWNPGFQQGFQPQAPFQGYVNAQYYQEYAPAQEPYVEEYSTTYGSSTGQEVDQDAPNALSPPNPNFLGYAPAYHYGQGAYPMQHGQGAYPMPHQPYVPAYAAGYGPGQAYHTPPLGSSSEDMSISRGRSSSRPQSTRSGSRSNMMVDDRGTSYGSPFADFIQEEPMPKGF